MGGTRSNWGAIRFLIECIIDDEHEKQSAIRGATYGFCISAEMAKFFYDWSIVALRHAFYEKVYMPFSMQDLLRASESYTFTPELMDIIGVDCYKEVCAKLGGKRIKIPTLQHLAKLKEKYQVAREVEQSDQDPDAVAQVAKKFKKTPRAAQEIFYEMTEQLDPHHSGEFDIYEQQP